MTLKDRIDELAQKMQEAFEALVYARSQLTIISQQLGHGTPSVETDASFKFGMEDILDTEENRVKEENRDDGNKDEEDVIDSKFFFVVADIANKRGCQEMYYVKRGLEPLFEGQPWTDDVKKARQFKTRKDADEFIDQLEDSYYNTKSSKVKSVALNKNFDEVG